MKPIMGTKMADLIYREAAIKHLKKRLIETAINNTGVMLPCDSVFADTAENRIGPWLNEVPSAQPEQRWIPCSDHLPDIKERHVSEPCIVYCSNGSYAFAELEENIFGQVGWNCERDDEYHEAVGEVVAWMPLPEPYCPEGEEQ